MDIPTAGLDAGPEMNAVLDARPAQPRAVAMLVPGPCFGENLPPLVGRLAFYMISHFVRTCIDRLHFPADA